MLNISGKQVVVVGGGTVATRKITSLLSSQAQVIVVSPELSPKLQQLAEENVIQWRKKSFSPEDIVNAFLIIAATNSTNINELVASSVSQNQLCNIVDNEALSQFIVPSVVQRGPLTIAVSTSGANPKLAKKIKQDLEDQYDESYEDYILFLQQARRRIIDEVKDSKKKSIVLEELLDSQFFVLTTTKQLAERENLFKKLLKKGTIQ
ncbi:bifunctional precorrin-2 dehydrogenase/sirohydrochlorin ferrochelatase [uncultured Rummeliibacillus sp.]|uniref:precorrin-2 dehydrogenase/sirohydrochlorin ferrochelatase family protein n=1 Tax=uncultured Rummeliibacillus sp. TaxID=762292 RepID=UPI00262FF071|nr:bifunctional precorrin-2 dehydrogenase/sirohydrochlorin ferrochelatase [uncultured Rummeliibacillus sp.]